MKALYRKYRPKSLAEVVGQEKVTKVLQNSLEKDRISHAYLFTGPRGTGKTSVARIFAHEINHFPYELEDSYVDIIEIDAASNTGVDNIRELREKATIAPTKGKYKVYIIDEVHMLSKSAFNALLKTLEEPPEHVVFLLATTDVQKVPTTITSRVQTLVFSLANKETMQSHLKKICDAENIKISDDAIEIIVRRGGGSFRDSLSLLDQIFSLASETEISKEIVEKSLGLPQDEMLSDLLNLFKENNLGKISEKLKEILSSGTKPETLAEEAIKKILESPENALLPLLEKLPEVHAPFPEAKLLLAFSNFKSAPAQPVSRPAPRPVFTKKVEMPERKPVDIPFDSEQKPEDNPPEIEPNSEEAPSKIESNSDDFSWENYLNSVKSASIGAAMWLKKCNFSLENGILHLYPPTSTVKGILESENNRKVLESCLKNLGIKLHDPSDSVPNSTKNIPKFDKINDIMGGAQEVKNGGEIPF